MNASIFDYNSGNVITEGLNSRKQSDEAINAARRIAAEREEPVVLHDEGDDEDDGYTIVLPDGTLRAPTAQELANMRAGHIDRRQGAGASGQGDRMIIVNVTSEFLGFDASATEKERFGEALEDALAKAGIGVDVRYPDVASKSVDGAEEGSAAWAAIDAAWNKVASDIAWD